ncbi:MAG: hypothetical protein HY907_11880 [Deltaproteobacteria bacterium]|nr:hypothetical protein [Deltaproteobacteria bacterium]
MRTTRRRILATSRSILPLLLLATAPGCRKDGRSPAAEVPASPGAEDVAAATPGADAAGGSSAVEASALPAGGDVGPAAPPADAGAPTAASNEPVDLGPVVAPELPVRLSPRDRGLKFSASVLAAGGGGSVVVATSTGNHAGYVFERVAAGWVETLRFELSVLGLHGSQERVAVSGDGDTIALAVVESHDCPGGTCPAGGAVGVWERRPGGWARTPNLPIPEETAYKGIGVAIAIDDGGDTIAVATRDEPGVYVYERAGDGWRQAAHLEGAPRGFGQALAMAGGRLAVGAPGWEDTETGAVLLFERRDGSWTPAGRVDAPSGADRTFGGGIALAGDILVAGGYGPDTERGGSSFMFVHGEDGAWSQAGRLEPRAGTEKRMFGRAAVAWGDGKVIAVLSLFSAHFFVRDGTTWLAGETVGGQGASDEVRGLCAAGPAAAVLTTSDVLLRAVPGLGEADAPAAPVRPAPAGAPDCSRGRSCIYPCAADSDCCRSTPCLEGIWASACVAEQCRMVGCTADEQCASIAGARCFQDADPTIVHGLCAAPCTADADCQAPYLCLDGGYCWLQAHNVTRCYSDLDCARRTGMKHCDVATGCCGCSDDAYCQSPMEGGDGTRCLPASSLPAPSDR